MHHRQLPRQPLFLTCKTPWSRWGGGLLRGTASRERLTLHKQLSCPLHFWQKASQSQHDLCMIQQQNVSSAHSHQWNLLVLVLHKLQPQNPLTSKAVAPTLMAKVLAIETHGLMHPLAACGCRLSVLYSWAGHNRQKKVNKKGSKGWHKNKSVQISQCPAKISGLFQLLLQLPGGATFKLTSHNR